MKFTIYALTYAEPEHNRAALGTLARHGNLLTAYFSTARARTQAMRDLRARNVSHAYFSQFEAVA